MNQNKEIRFSHFRKMIAVACMMVLTVTSVLLSTAGVYAAGPREIVRVGWYESPFNATDELQRRSGYAYDYQQKIAAYTGWTYEYVEGSWSDLLRMLEDGRIDLLSDVSYKDERAEKMLYSALPMGEEDYCLFAASNNKEISVEDYSTFNGKKVGVNKGSIQIDLFRQWEKDNGVQTEIVELSGSEEKNIEKLMRGEIDMYLSLEGFFDKGDAVPVCRIGSSEFYFAVSKSRPELLTKLNNAMSRIQSENRYYNQELKSEYLETSGLNTFLSAEELDWLDAHGSIRVGYQDNYLALCAKDPDTGELTGALKEYLRVASDCLENGSLDFQPVCYPTAADAMEALKNGEVDCMFPINLTPYDGEIRDVLITPAIMSTDMSAVVRKSEVGDFAKKDHITVAVNAGNPNYDMFLLDHFPDWRAIYYDNTPECLKAVADGPADCILISSYRYNNISGLCDRYRLTTWSTGVEMDYCLAVNRDDTLLYSILSKANTLVPKSTVNAALTYYFAEDARTNFTGMLKQNVNIIVIVFTVIVIILCILLFRAKKEKRNIRGQTGYTVPKPEDFSLMDNLPISYSVYHVLHSEHSELYDAEIVYVNHKYEEFGGLPSESVLGHKVRELYPYIGESWYQNARRAAIDGEIVRGDYVDPIGEKKYLVEIRRVICPGYCAITYMELRDEAYSS